MILLAGVERIEVGDPVNAENYGLAVYHVLLVPIPQRCLYNPRVPLRPFIAPAGDQPHAVAVALHAEPIAIIFRFVKPFRPQQLQEYLDEVEQERQADAETRRLATLQVMMCRAVAVSTSGGFCM